MAWWWFVIPIHSIWRLSNNFQMLGEDVWTIPCGFGASNNAEQLHSVPSSDPGFQLTSQIWADMCSGSGNGMMMDPYPHSQHMKVVKHLPYAWRGCANHSMWVWSLRQCMGASFCAHQWHRISADFPYLDLGWQVWSMRMTWWWIHLPIHSIWWLSNSSYMLGEDVWTIWCGSGASNNTQGHHLASCIDTGFQLLIISWWILTPIHCI